MFSEALLMSTSRNWLSGVLMMYIRQLGLLACRPHLPQHEQEVCKKTQSDKECKALLEFAFGIDAAVLILSTLVLFEYEPIEFNI